MTVILVDPRRPAVVPIDAVELLGGDVQYTEEMPINVQWSLPSARSALIGPAAPVLISSNSEHPEVKSRVAFFHRISILKVIIFIINSKIYHYVPNRKSETRARSNF